MIFKKKTGITAPTAGTCRVDRRTQVDLSSAAAPAVALSHREVVAMLTGHMIEIVGIAEKNQDRSCDQHDCCGSQLEIYSKVKIVRERLAYQNGGEEEDVLAVYCIAGGVVGCKVGFLAVRSHDRILFAACEKCHQAPEVLPKQGHCGGEDLGRLRNVFNLRLILIHIKQLILIHIKQFIIMTSLSLYHIIIIESTRATRQYATTN